MESVNRALTARGAIGVIFTYGAAIAPYYSYAADALGSFAECDWAYVVPQSTWGFQAPTFIPIHTWHTASRHATPGS